MKRMMFAVFMAVSIQTYCYDAGKELDAVISTEEYRLADCSPHLKKINTDHYAEALRLADQSVAEDILVSVSGGASVIGVLSMERNKRGMPYDRTFRSTLDFLKENKLGFNYVRYRDDILGDNYLSNESILKKNKETKNLESEMNSEERSAVNDYFSCSLVLALERKGKFAGYHEKYAEFARTRMRQSVIGNFSIKIESAQVKGLVGTGNKFAEPKPWDGARFFIIDAVFKNLDSESRTPFPGSLYINYNGKDYEFDSVEPIMLSGYNIWFDRVNPLLTMKTKIVYRIPSEIEGDVYWQPGRNAEGTRLWCGTINAAK